MSRAAHYYGENTPSIFDGYGITRFWSLFKSGLGSSNSILKIRPVDNSLPDIMVNFDSQGKISSTSSISGGASGTLSDRISSGVDHYAEELICQVTGQSIRSDDDNSKSRIISSSSLTTKNGESALYLNGGTGMGFGTPISELDGDFSMLMALSHDTAAGIGIGFVSVNAAGNYIAMSADRRTVKRHTFVLNSSFYSTDLITQLDSSDIRVLISTVNQTTKTITSYLDGALVGSVVYSGDWDNSYFKIGAGRGGNSPLLGHMPCLLVAPVIWDDTEADELTTLVKSKIGL